MMDEREYIHRDLNWCDFNERVLSEARDPDVPLLDRIKFMAIFSSNLDEFFRVKVAALRKLEALKKNKASKWLGYSPSQLLEKIYSKVSSQQNEFGEIWRNEILPGLASKNIHLYQTEHVEQQHQEELKKYFRVHVQGLLKIKIAKPTQEVELTNRGIYLVVSLLKKNTDQPMLGYVTIPALQVDRFKMLKPIGETNYYITLDDIIRINLPMLFSDYNIQGNAYSIKLNRDEDYEIEDEYTGDLIEKIKEKINNRMSGDPVRFLYDAGMPSDLLHQVQHNCNVPDSGIIPGGRYHNLNDLFQLAGLLSGRLEGQTLPQLVHQELDKAESILKAMEDKDFLLHFPYHDYSNVLRFFNEAAVDPDVTEIKVTLYRISKKSHIAQALITAAQNGKKVIVFVEVKARYDELNNLQWAAQMENAGITIIYSMPGLKVHAKVALIVKKSKSGKKVRYAYLATGNFNEKTATLYADHGLFTTSKRLTKELDNLFDFFKSRTKNIQFNNLLVAGFNMKDQLLDLITHEIEAAKRGDEAFVLVKLNGLDEEEMIRKLYEASQAGVKVQLIVRAGCSLVPGLDGLSENITAHRLVDMYLEHARVYWFCNGSKDRILLSSADWMNRNLNRRIEVGFPVEDEELKMEIKTIINLQLADNVKLTSIGTPCEVAKNERADHRAQTAIHSWLEQKENVEANVVR